MAVLDIYGDNNEDAKIVVDQTARVYRDNEEMKTAVMFDKDVNLESIVRYVSGMKWTVDYFLQYRNVNDEAKPLDVDIDPTLQSYYRITDLIITLQSPINQDDPDNITGEAIVNANFLPNYGDMFTATLAGNRQAVFTITQVDKKQYNLHSIYNIEFKLFAMLDTDSVAYRDLILKTIKEYIYNSDFIMEDSAPIIVAADYVKKLDYSKKYSELLDYYLTNFTVNEKNMICPSTESSIYLDTLLSDFIHKLINVDEDVRIQGLCNPSIDFSATIHYTLWDLILDRDINKLGRAKSNIGWKYAPGLMADVRTRTIGYMGVSYIANDLQEEGPDGITPIELYSGSDYTDPLLVDDDAYVLTNSFYTNDIENCGIIEQAVLQYLRGELVDDAILDVLLNEFYKWETVDQYYFIPILWVFLKDKTNNMFKTI